MGALLLVLVVTTGMLLVLAALVVGRKIARDRAEERSGGRRRRYAEILHGRRPAQLAMLVAEASRTTSAQLDLLVELGFIGDDLDAESRAALSRAARDFGLAALLVDGLDSRDPVVRGRSGLLLARLRVPEAPGRLERLLRDGDADVRLVACAGLALTESPDAARALVTALRERLMTPERLIERLGARWAVAPMLDLLRGEEREAEDGSRVRAHIARALGLAGDPAASPALVGLLCAGGEEERISAARALATAGGPEAVAPLVCALDDEVWPVRVQAARALGALGAAEHAPRLGQMLTDGAWWVRAAAAEALADLGDPGLDVLRAALASDDRFARDRAREQLALAALGTRDDDPAEHTALVAA